MADVVFWSGGMDSTLCALHLLRADKSVRLVTISNALIGDEHEKERLTRKQCLQKLKTDFGNNVVHEEYIFDGAFRVGSLEQASLWVSLYPLCVNDKDDVYLGFIRYSDFWHHKEQFEKAFHATCEFHDKKVKLHYPLEWTKKGEIRDKLKKYGYLEFTFHSSDGNAPVEKMTVK